MPQTFITHSKEETQQVAADFARTLSGGEVIALLGDIGAGKTTFTQGLVGALESTARVKSPTFAVLHEYPITGHSTIRTIVHIDFYRFTSPDEVRALELESYQRPDTVVVAEWPDLAGDRLTSVSHQITFRGLNETDREITFL
ncbi:MAG: tRNA (adenosine(37)-N6)-threonylcarbamoyltransferase complex ATPase subunit type 1 TsaE [Patescibacteria group bacterium]